MQGSLLVIVLVGLLLLSSAERRPSPTNPYSSPVTALFKSYAVFTVLTLLLLIFTDEVVGSSRPMFGEVSLPSIEQSNAFLAVFVLDVLGAGFLISATGGPRISAFSPVLFMLPTLAIFMRESPSRFILYAVLAGVCFFISQLGEQRRAESNSRSALTFYSVTYLCLALNILIGYVTRPL